jgi:hypothetical protein
MSSAFQYYGQPEEVLDYLHKTISDNQYQRMITQMSPEWRNAVVYVLGRSKSSFYLSAMYKAYEAGILNTISPDSVFAGSSDFEETVAKKLV